MHRNIAGGGTLPNRQNTDLEKTVSKARRSAKSNRLLVGNLPLEVTDADIYDLLSKAGEVRQIEILYNPKNGKQLGFAQVEMLDADQAHVVAQLTDGLEMQGRKLSVQPILSDKKTTFLATLLDLIGFQKRLT